MELEFIYSVLVSSTVYYGVVLQVSIAEEDRCFSIIPNIYLLLWQAGTLLSGWGGCSGRLDAA